jgi:serine protease
LRPGVSPRSWVMELQEFEGKSTRLQAGDLISPPMNIWSFSFDHGAIPENRFLDAVRRHPAVEQAQFNHFVTMRSTIPDDPQFPSQWQYINTGQSGGMEGADLDIDPAWDVTTGGVTIDGDTIVVAVLDDGIDLNHQDFEDNLWINYQEIPDNGIDDDGNGYVDDYLGWSTVTNSDNIAGGGHGTPVAGIVGAKGNNGIGVAGINWNVKVMVIKNNFNTNEAAVLEAYSYPLVMRQLYNETNGEKGAFVVATNASWGIDFGDPEDAPLWCAFYDTLGVHGVISCGATINGNVNVDEQGDLPTACPSDYLISVTNMNHNDQKVTGAGYGATTIDLGAFGAGTWTTTQGNGYGPFGGTSGATPHVTGTVGLLYSAPCPSLMALAKSDPAAAALLVKQYILDGVDPNESLDSITVTGGRLNINSSLQLLMADCGPCPPPSSLKATQVIDTSALLTWNVNDSILLVDLRWRMLEDTVWTEVPAVSSPYLLTDLLGCNEYEFQLKAFCSADTLDYSHSVTFKTDGCCDAPAGFTVSQITDSSALAVWGSVLAAESFNILIRESDGGDWIEFNTAETSFQFTGLDSCTLYEVQIQTLCDTTQTELGQSITFLTNGCGPCLDLEYCHPPNMDASEEWIALVEIDTLLSNPTGGDGGYGDYTGMPFITLEQGGYYGITLQPGFAGFSFSEKFRVWIDFDQDAEFENGEIVFDPVASTGAATGAFSIPPDATLGNMRMRVLMQFQTVGQACFNQNAFGEVEDYCIEIVPTSACRFPLDLNAWNVTDTSAQFGWGAVGPGLSYSFRYKKIAETAWTEVPVVTQGIVLQDLEECEEYEAQIRTFCAVDMSEFSESFTFETLCISSAPGALFQDQFELNVLPNPFSDEFIVEWTLGNPVTNFEVGLMDVYGRTLRRLDLGSRAERTGRMQFDGGGLLPGLYLLRMKVEGETVAVKKIMKL